MRIAAGFDHAGYPLKGAIVAALEDAGHEVVDCGTDSEESVDYPVHAAAAAGLVSEGRADLAVLACGSGTGVSIVANKVQGVRAVNARDPEEAAMARRHNDANVLALAGRTLGGDAGACDHHVVPVGAVRGRTPSAPRGPDRTNRERGGGKAAAAEPLKEAT